MGGRGASSFSDGMNLKFSNGLGTHVAATLKEAIGAKGTALTIEAAASGANPRFSKDSVYAEYKANCQRVVVAYELRRRGYDVIAQPTYKNDTMGRIVHIDKEKGIYHSRWSGAFQSAKIENVGGRDATQMMKNINKKMGSYGNGARAVLQVQWRGGGAHVFNIERQNGKTVYIDAQVNRRYTASYLKGHVKPGSVNIVRTDTLKLSDRARQSVTTRRY